MKQSLNRPRARFMAARVSIRFASRPHHTEGRRFVRWTRASCRSRMTVLLLVGSTALVACGDPSQTASPSSSAASTVADTSSSLPVAVPPTTLIVTSTSNTAPSSTSADPLSPRHIDHAGLSAALPIAAQFGWLPASALEENDTDLTSRLGIGDCSGQGSVTPSREHAATNRRYSVDQDSLVTVTFYDVETVEGAAAYVSALDALVGCATPLNPEVSFDVIVFADPTPCDDARGIRTHQPVSETIDEWCRVGNLIAWIRLDPTGVNASETDNSGPPPVAPTDEQGRAALVVVGNSLRAAWDAAG